MPTATHVEKQYSIKQNYYYYILSCSTEYNTYYKIDLNRTNKLKKLKILTHG